MVLHIVKIFKENNNIKRVPVFLDVRNNINQLFIVAALTN